MIINGETIIPTLKQTRLAAIATLSVLLTFSAAQAHDTAKGPNGGAMVQADDKHLEFTVSDLALTVYVSDAKHDTIVTAGATGRAIVQADGKTATVSLAPLEPNALNGKLDAPLGKGARVVVTATLVDGTNVQARFVVQ